jgi:MtfA peptidase
VLVGKPGRCFASVTAASRRNNLFFRFDEIHGKRSSGKVRDREDALAPASAGRDACATQSAELRLESAVIFSLLKEQRRRRLLARPFPNKWLTLIQRHVVFFHRLSESDKAELLGHIQVFLAEKRFEGCGGFAITDEVRVIIAAQACLLLLHRKTDYFPGLLTILAYPSSYMVEAKRQIGEHLWEEGTMNRLGETGRRMGSLVLSWDAVKHGAADPSDGKNVVLHEFAHQLDFENGAADGVPGLATREQQLAWSEVMRIEFASLRAADESGIPTLLDTYGATDPVEFFAVAVEAFFEQPRALRAHHPKLYAEFRTYFQQDPVEFSSETLREQERMSS